MPMTDSMEYFTRAEPIRASWRNRFRDKWPYLTSMMYEGETNTLQKLKHNSQSLDRVYKPPSTAPSSWTGSSTDIWTGPKSLDHEIMETVSSSDTSRRRRRPSECRRVCSNILCFFLALSVVAAIFAGIGLAVFLTWDTNGFASHNHNENHYEASLSVEEQAYLTQTFCNLVKMVLHTVDFPVQDGLESCITTLKQHYGQSDLHFEIEVTPKQGFTMIEKVERALRDQVLLEGRYRVNGTDNFMEADDWNYHPPKPPKVSSVTNVNKAVPTPIADTFSTTTVTANKTFNKTTVTGIPTAKASTAPTSVKNVSPTLIAIPKLSEGKFATISGTKIKPKPTNVNKTKTNSKAALASTNDKTKSKHKITAKPYTTTANVFQSNNNVTSVRVNETDKHTPGINTTATLHDHADSKALANQIKESNVSSNIVFSSKQVVKTALGDIEPSITLPVVTKTSLITSTPTLVLTTSGIRSSMITTDSAPTRLQNKSSEVLQTSTVIITSPTASILSDPVKTQTDMPFKIHVTKIPDTLQKQNLEDKIKAITLFDPTKMPIVKVKPTLDGTLKPIPTTKSEENRRDFVSESIMDAGGVKLPFKTNSNFRFLFSNGIADKSNLLKDSPNYNQPASVAIKMTKPDERTLHSDTNSMEMNRLSQTIIDAQEFDLVKTITVMPPIIPKTVGTISRAKDIFAHEHRHHLHGPNHEPKRILDVTNFGIPGSTWSNDVLVNF